jgi:hypothetical protein
MSNAETASGACAPVPFLDWACLGRDLMGLDMWVLGLTGLRGPACRLGLVCRLDSVCRLGRS